MFGKFGRKGYQVFKKTKRWVAYGGKVVEDCSYFIQEWTGWRWKPYKISGNFYPYYGNIKWFTNYAEAKSVAEDLAATARAKREYRRSLGLFQEPVEEMIWV